MFVEYLRPDLSEDQRGMIRELVTVTANVLCQPCARRSNGKEVEKETKFAIEQWKSGKGSAVTVHDEVLLSKFSHDLHDGKDRMDFFLVCRGSVELNVVVEVEAARPDQLSEKFVSRTAVLDTKRLVYIAACYPGPDSERNQAENYLRRFFPVLAQRLELAAFIGLVTPRPGEILLPLLLDDMDEP